MNMPNTGKSTDSTLKNIKDEFHDKKESLAHNAQSKSSDYSKQAESKISDFAHQAQSKVTDIGKEAQHKVSDLSAQAGDVVSEFYDNAQTWLQSNTGKTVATVALVSGISALAFFFVSKQFSSKKMYASKDFR